MSYWSRWVEGMKNLTPLQVMKSKRVGGVGQVLGLAYAMWAGYKLGFGYLNLFLGFTLFVMFVDLAHTHQQIKRIEKIRGR